MTQWHKMGMQAFIAKEIMRKDTLPFAIGMGCAAPRPRTARRPRDRPPFAASSPSWASTSTPASPVRGRRPASSARARPADARSLTPRAPTRRGGQEGQRLLQTVRPQRAVGPLGDFSRAGRPREWARAPSLRTCAARTRECSGRLVSASWGREGLVGRGAGRRARRAAAGIESRLWSLSSSWTVRRARERHLLTPCPRAAALPSASPSQPQYARASRTSPPATSLRSHRCSTRSWRTRPPSPTR